MREVSIHIAVLLLIAMELGGCATLPVAADPASDAPERRVVPVEPVPRHATYGEAMAAWQRPEDVNAWIGATFEYDIDRAMALSESQRADTPGPAIFDPETFFSRPEGVCVDLARFAVETLKRISPDLEARYLMIEFAPTTVRGNVLRRHWVAAYNTAEGFHVFADSKRPGVIAGPYRTVDEFIAEYQRYRGREIVAYREADSYRRTPKSRATRSERDP